MQTTTRIYEFPAPRTPLATDPFSEYESCASLPAVPVLPETLLAMELQLQQRSVDLHEVSQTVLGDLGATLAILRLAGQEHGSSEGRPARIEDCISGLGLKACLEAVASAASARGARQRAVQDLWAHSREIAHHA